MLGNAGSRTGSRCVSDDRLKSALILCIAHAIHARSAARGITATTGAARPARTTSDQTRSDAEGLRGAGEIREENSAFAALSITRMDGSRAFQQKEVRSTV